MPCETGRLYLLVNSCTLTVFPCAGLWGDHGPGHCWSHHSPAAAGQARSQINLGCWQVLRVEAECIQVETDVKSP